MSYTADIMELATMIYNKRPDDDSSKNELFIITNKMCGIDGLQLLLETNQWYCRLAYQFEHLYFDTNDEDYDPIDDNNKYKIALAYANYDKPEQFSDEEHINVICKMIDEFLKLDLEFSVMDGLVYKKGTSIYGKLHSVFSKYQSADEKCCVCNEATLTKTKCNHTVCLPCRNKICYGNIDATCPLCRDCGLCITKEENPGPLFKLDVKKLK